MAEFSNTVLDVFLKYKDKAHQIHSTMWIDAVNLPREDIEAFEKRGYTFTGESGGQSYFLHKGEIDWK